MRRRRLLDRFVYGDVERISPEAPIPVFRIISENVMLGGAGNVARNIAGLGRTRFVSIVGSDQAGRDVTAQVGEIVDLDARLITDTSRNTTIKTRYIASGQQMMRADYETVASLDGGTRKSLLDAAALGMENFLGLGARRLWQRYSFRRHCRGAYQMARLRSIPVIVDPQGNTYDAYMGATLVTPNRKESSPMQLDYRPRQPMKSLRAAAHLARQRVLMPFWQPWSGDGMTLVRNAENYAHYPAEAKEVFDVSGAGDTVVACITTAVAAGIAIEQAVALANVAAGIVVGKLGTAVAYADDLIDSLHQQERATGEAKVLSFQRLLNTAGVWRNQGHTVGFTNGCFDLLHPGHSRWPSVTRAACDKLIVGLNSDSSTKRPGGTTGLCKPRPPGAAVPAS